MQHITSDAEATAEKSVAPIRFLIVVWFIVRFVILLYFLLNSDCLNSLFLTSIGRIKEYEFYDYSDLTSKTTNY